SDWDLDKVPSHLRTTFRVRDDSGAVLAEDKDLAALQTRLRISTESSVSAAAAALERSGIVDWDLDTLPREFAQTRAGHDVRGYPALADDGDSVSIRVLANEAAQE